MPHAPPLRLLRAVLVLALAVGWGALLSTL
jgi:hypothetical protein